MLRAAIVVFASLGAALGQSLVQGSHRLEIVLEKRDGDAARAVEPGLVFQQNDRVRFRFRANFDGYLYVINQSTSGGSTLLFPTDETGRRNKIEAGKEYLVPATEGWFRIAGPPGHEIVYWLASPVELSSGAEGLRPYVPLPPPPQPGKAPANMTPRCDETILRARGDCVDSSAGAAPVSDGPAASRAGSRDLVFSRQQTATVVASPAPLTLPVVFEFRLAHK